MELLTRVVESIRPLDQAAMRAARERQDGLTKPRGSLGRLEDLAVRLAGITGRVRPYLGKPAVFVMAADHGVADEGVSLYPQEVTAQMVANFVRGGAGINVLARHVGARVVVVDVGVRGETVPAANLVRKKVAAGSGNIARGPAMTREQAVAAVEAGIEVVETEAAKGLDLAATGDMGIGNTTPSSAVCAVLTGASVEAVTGRGTGLDDAGLARKCEVIRRALEVNRPDPSDPLDVLAKVGGFEIGAIAGVILACAAHRIPVVIDGFVSGAGALIAAGLAPLARDYMIAGHLSAEPGHAFVLKHLGLDPLLCLDMRLGEGTGACLGMFLVAAAAKLQAEMATFSEAGVARAGVE
ncbi:MAG: nicotinate-nucleotide--dimethylbenzimidazole phosphoribosyltransferase [Desulfotomaculales bacterium]